MSQSDNDNAFIYHVIGQDIPLVILDRDIDIESEKVINILSDDKDGVFNAVEYIIKNGHKDIALLTGRKEFKSTEKRKEGFIDALIKNKLQIHDEYIVSGNYSLEGGYKAMTKLISLKNTPTAVFCSNDDMAIGAIKAIVDANLKIPKDISIVGFDDIKFAAYTSPTLTTIKRKIERISEIAGEKILDMIDGKKVDREKIFVKTDFIIRDSVLKLDK
jgi:LacI family transcriptional regulator